VHILGKLSETKGKLQRERERKELSAFLHYKFFVVMFVCVSVRVCGVAAFGDVTNWNRLLCSPLHHPLPDQP